MGRQGANQLVESQEVEVAVFAGGDQIVGKEGGGFVGRDATVFLVPLLLIYALGLESSEEGFIGFVAAGLFVDPGNKPLLDGELARHGMKSPALGITAV